MAASRGASGRKGVGPREQKVISCARRPAQVTYSIRRNDSEFEVFCFSKPEDAKAFAERFGRERLPVTRGLETNGCDPKATP